MKIRTGLAGLAVSGAVFLVLWMPMREASPTVSPAPARAQHGSMSTSAQIFGESPPPAIESVSYALVIREAHSDGGYWYWRE